MPSLELRIQDTSNKAFQPNVKQTGPERLGYALVMDKAGNLYGTTKTGGRAHNGSLYKLTKNN
jgi:uncharacterized repeat protein (TIGR03803 family)